MIISRRNFLKFGASVGLIAPPPFVYAGTCNRTSKSNILVGGVTGFDSLGKAANSSIFRDTCRAGLYIHSYIWNRTNIAEHKAVLNVFSDAPVDIELGFVSNPEAWFKNNYQVNYIDAGVTPQHAHVNGFNIKHFPMWNRYVETGKKYGLKTIAPVFSPNSGQFKKSPFRSAAWDFLRDGAKTGGALTTDSPPHYFLDQSEEYRQFIVDELNWANSTGLYSTFIISPNLSKNNFLEDTKKTVSYLEKKGVRPTTWVVENYNAKAPPSYPNRIGRDDENNTVLGVALWLAKYAT